MKANSGPIPAVVGAEDVGSDGAAARGMVVMDMMSPLSMPAEVIGGPNNMPGSTPPGLMPNEPSMETWNDSKVKSWLGMVCPKLDADMAAVLGARGRSRRLELFRRPWPCDCEGGCCSWPCCGRATMPVGSNTWAFWVGVVWKRSASAATRPTSMDIPLMFMSIPQNGLCSVIGGAVAGPPNAYPNTSSV